MAATKEGRMDSLIPIWAGVIDHIGHYFCHSGAGFETLCRGDWSINPWGASDSSTPLCQPCLDIYIIDVSDGSRRLDFDDIGMGV